MSPLLLVLPLASFPAPAVTVDAVTVDPGTTHGAWEGWGTSLCWMGKQFGTRDDLADLLFTTRTVRVKTTGPGSVPGSVTVPGLGMTIVRYNAGACSWNAIDGRRMVVSKTIQPFRQMEGFWLDGKDPNPASKGWDWSVDAAQRAMLRKAKARGANRFELFSNSPMWWMCANDNPSGAADPKRDNLNPARADDFAHYLAAIARRAKERWGVAFTTVSPFNEPASSWWDENCKQEGCHFSAATQADFLPRLRRELDREGLRDLPIAASDETYFSQGLATWNAWSPATRALVRQVNVHGYEGNKSPREALRTAVGDQPRWLSEHGENDASGLSLARRLHLDLAGFRPQAWCYWQPLDGGGWGLLDADVPGSKIRRADPKLFVLAQYTRHIRSGMTILGTSTPDTIAAYDPARRKLVLVARTGAEGGARTFDLSRFAGATGPVVRWTTEPKATARYARTTDLKLAGRRLEATLAPDSVQTFEISGVRL